MTRHDLGELLAGDPQFAERPGTEGKSPAKNVAMTQKVWSLKLPSNRCDSFKWTCPTPMAGCNRNWSGTCSIMSENPFDEPVKFIPVFSLQNRESGHIYPDQLIPVAIPYIQRREDPNRKLLNTIEIEGEIPAGQEAWGVATWTDMDRRWTAFRSPCGD